MGYVKNMVKHFNKINKHRFYVFLFCCKAGIPMRGLFHDLSKYSPVEFFEGAKYYQGTSSPIDECKKRERRSLAWLHHKGRNRHHYEYWYDEIDAGSKPILMTYEDALEMICGYLGTGKAYNGKDFSYEKEWKWWMNKKKTAKMHPFTLLFVEKMMYELKRENNSKPLKKARVFYCELLAKWLPLVVLDGEEAANHAVYRLCINSSAFESSDTWIINLPCEEDVANN